MYRGLQMNFEQYEVCLVELIKDSVLNRNTYKIPDDINIDTIINIAKLHKIFNLIYPTLSSRGISNPEMVIDFCLYIAVDAKQKFYLDKIRKRLEEEKIRFVCMKGAVLKELYSETFMRSSSDIDIFVDDENTDKVRDIMTDLGFETERFSHQIQDDVYSMGKIVYVEIHRKLMSGKCPWDKKCQEIIKRVTPKAEGTYECVMSAEDFYLHMIGHMAKHMKHAGFGIRMIIDAWIYLNRFGDSLDREILDKRLKYCGLDVFENEIVKLVDYWFNGKQADERTKALGRYVLDSGIFGTAKQYNATEMAEFMGKGKNNVLVMFKKFWKVFFLPYGHMCLIYPNLSGKPILLPIYWAIRAFDVVLHKRGRISEISKVYDKVDTEYAKKIIDFKKGLGL